MACAASASVRSVSARSASVRSVSVRSVSARSVSARPVSARSASIRSASIRSVSVRSGAWLPIFPGTARSWVWARIWVWVWEAGLFCCGPRDSALLQPVARRPARPARPIRPARPRTAVTLYALTVAPSSVHSLFRTLYACTARKVSLPSRACGTPLCLHTHLPAHTEAASGNPENAC